MNNFCLIDYRPQNSNINRDMTGNFGSDMNSNTFTTAVLGTLKRKSLKIPVTAFSQAVGLLQELNISYEINESMPNKEFDVFIFMTSIINLKDDQFFLKKLKERFPQSKIGVVGAINKSMPELFDEITDFNIMSELDTAIIAFSEGKWNFEGNFNEDVKIDINTLPIPSWAGFPVESYSYKPGLANKNFLTIQSSRGCSFNCDYCSYMVVQGGKTRNRNLDLIKAEVEQLINYHDVRSILFRDILFGHPKKRFNEIVEVLSEFKGKFEWGCETRIELLTNDLVKKAVDSGMRLVNIGIESPNTEILFQNGKKTFSNDETANRVKFMNELDVNVQAFYMLGLVGDNKKTINETIDYAKKLNTFAAQFCLPTPYPGTKFAEDNINNTFNNSLETYDAYTPQMKVDGMTKKDLEEIHAFAYRTYYMNPSWIKRNFVKAFKNIFL